MSIPEHKNSWLVIASSSANKINAYREYPFGSIDSRNPEEVSGAKEIESDDAALVAWVKASVVLDAVIQAQDENPSCYVTGVDILSSYKRGELISTPGGERADSQDWNVLHKVQKSNKVGAEEKLIYETMELYCNDPFSFRWHSSAAVIHSQSSVSNVSVLEILAEFPPLPESVVYNAAKTGMLYKMSPRIPLAMLADKHALRVLVKNRDVRERAVNIPEEVLIKLVIEGVLPFAHFSTLLKPVPDGKRCEPYTVINLDLAKGFRYSRKR